MTSYINFLIVLVITWIFMNSSVLSVNFNLILFLYFDVSPLRLTKGLLKPLLTYLLTNFYWHFLSISYRFLENSGQNFEGQTK